MKTIKMDLDETVLAKLETMAKEIGYPKVQDYIRMVLGLHVKERKEAG